MNNELGVFGYLIALAISIVLVALYLIIWVATWAAAIWAIYHLLNHLGLIQ
jgi:hypothetical protein